MDEYTKNLRLKRPCGNCPFLKKGAIALRPGRLDEIMATLVEDDHSSFHCHKTINYGQEERKATGSESMCAGAAAYLMKVGRPNLTMRFAFAFGLASPDDWNEAQAMTVDVQSSSTTISDKKKSHQGPITIFEKL